jgi:hypothetical protein
MFRRNILSPSSGLNNPKSQKKHVVGSIILRRISARKKEEMTVRWKT